VNESLPMSVAIVSFNTREHLDVCIASIDRDSVSEVIVVDNGSSDGSVEMVASRYPWITLIQSSNDGYGASGNIAARHCSTEYLLLLNSDVILQPGCVPTLASYLQRRERAAIAGPRINNPDGSLQISCFPFPTPLHVLLRETRLGRLVRLIPGLRSRYLLTWPHNRQRVVPTVLGAALAIRKSAFSDINGFDESYFMFSEEVDLCYRLKQSGWETHFVPEAQITHVGGASVSQFRATMLMELYASRKRFYKTHFSTFRFNLVRAIVSYTLVRNAVVSSHRARLARRRGQQPASMDASVWRAILSLYWSDDVDSARRH
jgi:N-acetylglucosaminyl-diphospho-decaprenol L-rhamnosyltransferase